jgi:hypothetical protein
MQPVRLLTEAKIRGESSPRMRHRRLEAFLVKSAGLLPALGTPRSMQLWQLDIMGSATIVDPAPSAGS